MYEQFYDYGEGIDVRILGDEKALKYGRVDTHRT